MAAYIEWGQQDPTSSRLAAWTGAITVIITPITGGSFMFEEEEDQMATQAYDFETVTVSSTAIGPTATKLVTANTGQTQGCKELLVSVEGAAIRYRFDGSDPTASVGHGAAADTAFIVRGNRNIRRLKMIRVSGDATVRLTFSY